MEVLKISHENDLSIKDTLIKELREYITKYEGISAAEEFIKEALALNALFSKQQNLFILQISNIVPHLEISEQLTNTVIDQRIEFKNSILKFLTILNGRIQRKGESQISQRSKKILKIFSLLTGMHK